MHIKIILTSKIKHLQVVIVMCTLQKIATDLFFSLISSLPSIKLKDFSFFLSLLPPALPPPAPVLALTKLCHLFQSSISLSIYLKKIHA